MTVTVDRRCITARREPEAEECLADGIAALRDLQIRLAKSFARIDASAHFVFSGCASVVEYAKRLGYSAYEARTLTLLGKTLAAAPEAEARLRAGEIGVEAAAAVGRVLSRPERVHAGDDWLQAAASEPMRALRRRVRARLELHAQGESGVEEVTVHVAPHVRDKFTRAREVASQKAGEPLTEGQTFHRVVDFYLAKNDPLRQAGAKRRVGRTQDRPESRYVPREVLRAVWKRAEGRCEVGSCEHALKLQLAHRTPHAEGSGREVKDLGLLCPRHHTLYDAGKIPWPVASPENPPQGGASMICERAPPFGPAPFAEVRDVRASSPARRASRRAPSAGESVFPVRPPGCARADRRS